MNAARVSAPRPTSRVRARGSALVATLVLGLATVGAAGVLAHATYELGAELRVRREVLCARYAALAGLALGPSVADQAAAVGDEVDSLSVAFALRAAQWCVVRSTARCGSATRTVERAVAVANCGA